MQGKKALLYVVAVTLAVTGVTSQYFIPSSWFPGGWSGFALDLFIVYGIGLLVFFVFFGAGPLRNFIKRPRLAVKEGLRWYGIFGVIGLVVAIALVAVYLSVEPARAGQLLNRQTPVIQEGAANPIFFILFSIFFIGFVEETLFRGYVLGTVLTLDGTARWRLHAFWSSLLFAGVHLYYAQTYLEVSPVFYVRIVALGLAFSYAYVRSGGNILMIGILHGGFDALTFFSLTSLGGTYGVVISYVLLGGAALFALALYMRSGPERDASDGAPHVLPGCWPPSDR